MSGSGSTLNRNTPAAIDLYGIGWSVYGWFFKNRRSWRHWVC